MKKMILCGVLVLLVAGMLSGCLKLPWEEEYPEDMYLEVTQPGVVEPTKPAPVVETGYISSSKAMVAYCDAEGNFLGVLTRGQQVEYIVEEDGTKQVQVAIGGVYLQEGTIVEKEEDLLPAHTQYVRTAVNLRDADGKLLPDLLQKGTAVEIIGYDYMEDGKIKEVGNHQDLMKLKGGYEQLYTTQKLLERGDIHE